MVESSRRSSCDGAGYPATTSREVWANEILVLDQLVGEGFRPKPLRAMVAKSGRAVDNAWGSFKLMEECLLGHGAPEDEVKKSFNRFERCANCVTF
jgi:hypothetical protein